MNRTRTLLPLALVTLVGLALAQGMMGTPNDPRNPGNGYGNYGNDGGYGMMRPGFGGRGGYGMMGGNVVRVLPPDAEPLDDAELRARLDAAARAFGPDVSVDDVMPFTDHSYAQFVAPDGTGLAEVLVDRYTGVVTPEPGPNMMWNLRSGMGGYGRGGFGMNVNGVGPWGATPNTAEERYDETQARDLAATFLAGYLPGADVLASQTFPGYMTFDYGRDGRIDGMLSVNFGSGQIWPHTWHGAALGDAHD
ncbi:MAG: hypothetical protein P1P87_12395 [Trueperaceae bacterium]|nr:hypothetical protein [Trueperaceae bacterium]